MDRLSACPGSVFSLRFPNLEKDRMKVEVGLWPVDDVPKNPILERERACPAPARP